MRHSQPPTERQLTVVRPVNGGSAKPETRAQGSSTHDEQIQQRLDLAKSHISSFKKRFSFIHLNAAIYFYRDIVGTQRKAQRLQIASACCLIYVLLLRHAFLLHPASLDEAVVVFGEVVAKDLQESVSSARCMRLIPFTSSNYVLLQTFDMGNSKEQRQRCNLAATLTKIFLDVQIGTDDLNRAIELLTQAVQIKSSSPSVHSTCLIKTAAALRIRYYVTGNPDDLALAVRFVKELCPVSSLDLEIYRLEQTICATLFEMMVGFRRQLMIVFIQPKALGCSGKISVFKTLFAFDFGTGAIT